MSILMLHQLPVLVTFVQILADYEEKLTALGDF